MARLLLTFPPAARENYYPPAVRNRLAKLAEVRLHDAEVPLGPRELIESARDCDVIVADRQAAAPAALFDALPALAAFVRCAVDIRNVDVAAASHHGVLVTQASAGFAPAVAEWCLGVMVDLARGISAASGAYHRGEQPSPAMGRELKGATAGIIGYGRIARYLCELCAALQMRICVYSPYDAVDAPGRERVSLSRLLGMADYVVCLALATAETENLMDAAAFACMKPTAFFVNASRGALVDEIALADALDAGRIAGCALDVGREGDDRPSLALARHPRVIATPHIGGLTPQAALHQADETVAQVACILDGRVPPGAVNADAASRLSRFVMGSR